MKEYLVNIAAYSKEYINLIKSKNSLEESEYNIKINTISELLVNNLKFLELCTVNSNSTFKETIEAIKQVAPEFLTPLFAPILVQGYLLQGYASALELISHKQPAKEAVLLLSKIGGLYLNKHEMNDEELMTDYFIYHLAFAFVVVVSAFEDKEQKAFKQELANIMQDIDWFLPFAVGVNLTDKILTNPKVLLPPNISKSFSNIKLKIFSKINIKKLITSYLNDHTDPKSITYEQIQKLANEISHIFSFCGIEEKKTADYLLNKSKDEIFAFAKTKSLQIECTEDSQFAKYMMLDLNSLNFLQTNSEDKAVIKDAIRYKTFISENRSELSLKRPVLPNNKKSIFYQKEHETKQKEFKLKMIDLSSSKNNILIAETNSCELLDRITLSDTKKELHEFKDFTEYNIVPFGLPFKDFAEGINIERLRSDFSRHDSYLKAFYSLLPKERAATEISHKNFFNKNKTLTNKRADTVTNITDLFPEFSGITIYLSSKYSSKLLLNSKLIDEVALFLINTKEDFTLQKLLGSLAYSKLFNEVIKLDARDPKCYDKLSGIVTDFVDIADSGNAASIIINFTYFYLFSSEEKKQQIFCNYINELFFKFEFISVYKNIKSKLDKITQKEEIELLESIDNLSLDLEQEQTQKNADFKLVNLNTTKSFNLSDIDYQVDFVKKDGEPEMTVIKKLKTVQEQTQEEIESPKLQKPSLDSNNTEKNDMTTTNYVFEDRLIKEQFDLKDAKIKELERALAEKTKEVKDYEAYADYLESEINSKLSGITREEHKSEFE
jgi:hypothetical protein